MKKMITLARQLVDIDDVNIPDLWHVAMLLKNHSPEVEKLSKEAKEQLADQILKTWHIAHALKKYIKEVDVIVPEKNKEVHVDDIPPWKHQKIVDVLNCYNKPRFVYVDPKREC